VTISNCKPLFRQLTDGIDISVEQNEDLTTLHFNNGLIQSQINSAQPLTLPLTGNRMMLLHLMFGIEVRSVLLAGSGGGAIGLWFIAQLPGVQGLALEKSKTVISLARQYFNFPPAESNWRIKQGEIQDFLAATQQCFDFILFDIEEQGKTPEWLTHQKLLKNCRNHLTDQGVASFNIVAHTPEDLAKSLGPIRQAFPGNTCCLSSPENNNIIVCAFNSKPSTDDLSSKADAAKVRYNIEFDLFYQQLLKDNPPHSGIF
jgi:spermidine synthase